MVRLNVKLDERARITEIQNPVRLSGWGSGREIVIWAVGFAYNGEGCRWDLPTTCRFYFDQEGDDGCWRATIDRMGDKPRVVEVQDLSFT